MSQNGRKHGKEEKGEADDGKREKGTRGNSEGLARAGNFAAEEKAVKPQSVCGTGKRSHQKSGWLRFEPVPALGTAGNAGKTGLQQTGAIVYSQEAVGAAKVVLLAVRRMEFEEEKAGQRFTNGELYEAIKDIYEA